MKFADKIREYKKNAFVKFFFILLFLTLVFDLYYGNYEASQTYLTGMVFGNLLVFLGTLYGLVVLILVIKNYVINPFLDSYEFQVRDYEATKPTKRAKTTSRTIRR